MAQPCVLLLAICLLTAAAAPSATATRSLRGAAAAASDRRMAMDLEMFVKNPIFALVLYKVNHQFTHTRCAHSVYTCVGSPIPCNAPHVLPASPSQYTSSQPPPALCLQVLQAGRCLTDPAVLPGGGFHLEASGLGGQPPS